MKNKTIIVAIILVVILGLAGYFFYKKSTTSLTPEFQLLQPPTPPAETQPLPQASTPTEESLPQSQSEIQLETQPQTQHIVIYSDSGFSPATLSIKVGETVVFKNESSRAMWPASDLHPTHRLYSGTSLAEHCPDTTGTAFDACTGIQPGNSWSFTFNKKGTWPYHDHLNPASTGTIIVE